jgi:two-component system, sensor histidine kinase
MGTRAVTSKVRPSLCDHQVLVVDDSSDNQVLLSTVLKAQGARVWSAADGEEALRLAAGASFDTILMDIQMPVLDGWDCTKELRRRGYAGVIIALTAHDTPDERMRCFQAGCDEHLVKPVNFGQLVRTIRQLRR